MKNNRIKYKNIKYLIALVLASLIMSVGYATINSVTMQISGTAEMAENGSAKIVSITRQYIHNLTENTPAQINANGDEIDFDFTMTVNNSNAQSTFDVQYKITIQNDSLFDHLVQATNFTADIHGNASNPTHSFLVTDSNGNIALNDTIPAKSSKDYYLTITFYPSANGSWTISGGSEIGTGEIDEGNVLGSLPNNSTCNLRGSNTTCLLTASVMNTHQGQKSFTFSINNNNVTLVDENGNSLSSMTIDGETTDTFDFYIKKVDGARFPSNSQNINVNFNSGDDTSSMGIVTLLVDADPTLLDNEAPIIAPVIAEIRPNLDETYTNYKLYVSWEGSTDNSGVDHYVVETYRSTTQNGTYTKISTNNTVADETNISITVPSDGYYYFKVYGVDIANPANTATSSEISSCPTTSNSDLHCRSTEKEQFKWNFTVTITVSNVQIQGKTAQNNRVTYNVMYDGEVNATISGTGDYQNPRQMTNPQITYANGNTETLSTNSNTAGYSYSPDNGQLHIWHINGDITMTASGYQAWCLAKGTKVLLANGKSKNIENIGYDDLLAVWSYDEGKISYEYPLWIEKKQYSSEFTKINFSDGSYIDVVGSHSFYNTDINLFVDHLDSENFHVGSHVAKITNDGQFKIVSVEKIKTIKKETEYYFVGSTTYYNIIANNLLTSHQDTIISNLYGFIDNATWPKEKAAIVNNKDNYVNYSKVKDVLPYYMYKGFRASELGFLINNNIMSIDDFKYWIAKYVMSEDLLLSPIQKENFNYWMVTTSEDSISDYNKNMYLKKEGSIYKLPTSKKINLIGWFNTADNKMYYPNDLVRVDHGLHFIAIYKD